MKISILSITLFAVINLNIQLTFGQSAPSISYSGPKSYPINIPITPLAPVNAGGTSIFGGVGGGNAAAVAGSGGTGNTNNASGSQASFRSPFSIAADSNGNLYIAESGNHLIRKIVIASTAVSTLAGGNGASFSGSKDSTGTASTFNLPQGIVIDPSGTNLYVADYGNNLIRKIVISTAEVTTLAGGGSATGTTAGAADGTGRGATFNGPNSLAIDPAGTNLYVSDFTNNLIRKIVIATGVVTTVAGGGSPGGTTPGSSNGTGTAATFSGPQGLVVNRSNTSLYVADSGNNLIRKIELSTGVVTTIAGGTNVWGITAGYINDIGTAARFKAPYGLAIIGDEFLYVADYNNSAIRQIDLATGMVTTILAGGTFVTGPKGMVFDTNGYLFYTDIGQAGTTPYIRKLIPVAFSINPAMSTGLTFDTSTGNISGTPTILSPTTTYTIMAANSIGGNKATVSIQVTSDADPMLSNLVSGSGTISPTFAAATTSYTLNVLKFHKQFNIHPNDK